MSCSSFWLDNSTDRLVASVSWIYQLKSQWSACPFFAKIQWENKWLQHNEENLLFWSVLAICCQWLRLGWWLELLQGEHPSQEVCTLNAPSSIFAEGFPTFVLRWNTSIVSFRKFFSFIFSGSKERRTSGLLWFPSNLDCMNAISRAVRRYFRSSSWNLAQILFSGYH